MPQHILNKNPVSFRRILHKHMRDGAHKLPVLHNRRAAHALYNPACKLQQAFVRDLNGNLTVDCFVTGLSFVISTS